VPGNGDATLNEWPHFLGLGDSRHDSSWHLWRTRLTRIIFPLCQHQRCGEVTEQSPLMRWTATKNTAFATMTHDETFLTLRTN
jgi:hypothetical protein